MCNSNKIHLDCPFLRKAPALGNGELVVVVRFLRSPSTLNLVPSTALFKQSKVPSLFGNSEEPYCSVIKIEDGAS